MRIAVLVKQIPATDSLTLGADGRLVRAGLALEINPFCRRAISLGISLARDAEGSCVAFTLAPLSGEDVLREAVAAGADEGVLISDPAFAGSDTLATARALAGALEREGPFDLIICGRNSVDADTGQIGPEVAELLGLPFVANVTEVRVANGEVFAQSERDDGRTMVRARLPAVLSAAERCCAPARADAAARAAVPARCVRRLTAQALGPGPWGAAGSPTKVGEVRFLQRNRHQTLLTGPLVQQVSDAVGLLSSYDALAAGSNHPPLRVPQNGQRNPNAPQVAVILEPNRGGSARELCAAGAMLAQQLEGTNVGLVCQSVHDWPLSSWGLDHIVVIRGASVEEDVARVVVSWIKFHKPMVILAPASLWGREVASRIAASLDLGLIGDAVELEMSQGRVVAWKPALGGRLLARIVTDSDPQMVTLRMGSTAPALPRSQEARFTTIEATAMDRVKIIERHYDDDADILFSARAVIGVGMGVPRNEYHLLEPLIEALDAPLACSRKVADKGWLSRTRQVGLTGHHIAPRLYVAIGLQGAINHVVGVRRSGVVLAINSDREAPIFNDADIGIIGDWREVVSLLAPQIASGLPKMSTSTRVQNDITDDRGQVSEQPVCSKALPEARRA